MIVALDLLIFAILIVSAVLALRAPDLLTAVSLLAAYSLFAALLFAGVSAVDVALVEAALGAGLTGVLFIAAIILTTRRSTARDRRPQQLAVGAMVLVFAGLMLWSTSGLPDRGDPDAPAQLGISQVFIERSLPDTETPNVVTSLLADFRSQDTLGETLVILTAALAAVAVLARRGEEPELGPADLDLDDVDDGEDVAEGEGGES